jgi:DNA-repair protein XRCC2
LAVVFDTEHSFSFVRFRQLLLSRIRSFDSGSASSQPTLEILVEPLSRFVLFRPESSIQLAVSLMHLSAYHASNHPHHELGLVSIDSLSTFYWSDRYASEHVSSEDPGVSSRNPLHHILTAMKMLLTSHSPIMIYTNWALYPEASHSGSDRQRARLPFYRNHLKPPLHDALPNELNAMIPLAYHITLTSALINSAPTGNKPHSETTETHQRDEAAQILGRVRYPGSSQIINFTFQIAGDSISIGDRV